MKILLLNNGTKYIENLRALLHDFDTEIVNYNGDSIEHDEYDLIVLSGGGHKNNTPVEWNKDYYKNELDLIRSTDKPLVGVCLGFELIVDAYGGKLVEPTKERIRGEIRIQIEVSSPIFGRRTTFNVFENHKWVAQELPQQLVSLASSVDGIEIIKHRNKDHYGFQFHPEVLNDNKDGAEIFLNTIKLFQ